MRSLARRSAEAAKEIKALIGDSVTNVDAGAKLVHEALRTMDDVTNSVEEVNELIGVIAVASREQASGVEGINSALAQLQGATQHNASVVQDAAYSAVTLKEEAGRLFELVGRFQVDDIEPVEPAPARSSPAAVAAAFAREARPPRTTRLLSG